MSFTIPTLKALSQKVREGFRAELPGSDAWLWPNNIAVTAKVIALTLYEHFLRLDWLHRQVFATTADGEYLDRHASEFGLIRKGPTFAEGFADWTGTTGTNVAAGTLVTRSDGVAYRVVDPAIVTAGAVRLQLRASLTGSGANAAAGAPLALGEALSGLADAGTVADGGIGAGAATESDEQLRARILYRKRHTPMGGAVHDYVIWAGEVAGVTRVFVEPLAYGLGTVGVWVLMDDLYATGIPAPADVATVRAWIEPLAPASAIVCVLAPTPVEVPIKIRGLDPATRAVKDAAIAEIFDAFRRRGEVGRAAAPFTFSRSWISEAISAATGEARHELLEPADDILLGRGEMAVPGTIRFVT